MKWLSAGLVYVNFAAVSALLLGMVAGGVNRAVAIISLFVGFAGAAAAFVRMPDRQRMRESLDDPAPTRLTRAERRRRAAAARPEPRRSARERYGRIWLWLAVACFAVFALRSFCWLLYIDGNELKIQSPNNLGDLALHLTYIRNFANGAPLWPDNPIFLIGKLRYPGGTDLFNGLLACLRVDLLRGLVWTGLLGSAATCYALYRWAGTFGIAGFLFNGGLAGYQVFRSFEFLDYQGDKTIAWKSLALSMLVTQRGLLYALPAGLLLLYQWRSRFFSHNEADTKVQPVLPRWVELSLYATMPLFHVHTFLCLSIVLGFAFLFGRAETRRSTVILVLVALLPASFLMWIVSDQFHAGSIMQWQPGWVQNNGDFAMPFLQFWLVNFGAWVPAVLAVLGFCGWNLRQRWQSGDRKLPGSVGLLSAATFIFLLAVLVKTAPWEWDNTKVIIWAYLIVLPFVWSELIQSLQLPIRALVCVALFGSGFVSLIGGLGAGKNGYGLADRGELDSVGVAVRKLPVTARYATHPTYNHPVLLQGRKVIMGYPGHLWTQGFNYSEVEPKLTALLKGEANWRHLAGELQARYLFWGREEKTHYPDSARPWERELRPIASGSWGGIYDLGVPPGASQ